MSSPRSVTPSFHPELARLTELGNMNPTILPIGIAVGNLAINQPFIAQQLCELTGLQSSQVHRNITSLYDQGMIMRLTPPVQNRHLRPYARTENPRWEFFTGICRLAGIVSIQDLFGRTWDDIPGWLRSAHGEQRVKI